VIERVAEGVHLAVEFGLAGMAERRMTQIVGQRERLGKVGVEAENPGHGAGNLRHFQSMCQAVAEVIGKSSCKNLRLGFEAAEGARVNHTVAVALEGGAIGMFRFGIAAAAARFDGKSKMA